MSSSYISAVSLAVGVYRHTLGTLLPTACKHHPTCSEYCLQAIDGHGFIIGTALTAGRLLRCHPFSKGGYDPVPPAKT